MGVYSNLSRPRHARTTSMKFLLRLANVATTSYRSYYAFTTLLLRPGSAILPTTLFFKYVQSSSPSFSSMKTLLRSYHTLQVSTTLLLRPTNSYCVHHCFQRRSKNVAECEGVIIACSSNYGSGESMHRRLTRVFTAHTQSMDEDKESDQFLNLKLHMDMSGWAFKGGFFTNAEIKSLLISKILVLIAN